MIQKLNLRTDPRTAATPSLLAAECARRLSIAPERIVRTDITRRSIDARQRKVAVELAVTVHVDTVDTSAVLYEPIVYPSVADAPEVTVVGAGPAGLFAALELIELGFKPIVIERGKDVDSRRTDLAALNREGRLDPESNYCFGEGGAGAYSDGKLYTRSRKRGPVDKVLKVFCQHGAQESILVDAHPHIGSDRLPGVIRAMRQTILASGGEVHFGTRMERLLRRPDGTVEGLVTADGRRFPAPIIMATGHSARDVYRMLADNDYVLEAKGIAVGVRLEHPQHLIDCLQYHSREGRGKWLPAAEYSMLARVDDRAVYSFCMCPGGYVIPAACEAGSLVVNGMSPANRGTRWANSGMVVEVLPEDVPAPPEGTPEALKVMLWQDAIERRFSASADGTMQAPAQRMTDFVAGTLSDTLPRSSYPPGLVSRRVDELLPEPIARRLKAGFDIFGKRQRGFLTPEATVLGCETRTSSPVRVVRMPDSLTAVDAPGLYPCGEGAGYAGGIVSAAVDGILAARAVAQAAAEA